MTKTHKLFIVLLFFISIFNISAQDKSFDELEGSDIRIYKTVDGFDLKMSIIYPENYDKGKKQPTIVFFFGGGWVNGNTCYVVPFEGQGHGYFNYGRSNGKYYDLTIEKTESFLQELMFIK